MRHDGDGLSSVYSRAAEQAHKLALIHAVSSEMRIPPEVGLESVKWACGLMDWTMGRMARELKANVAYSPQDALRRRVLAELDEKGRIDQKRIYRILKDCTHKQAEDVVTIIVNAGLAMKVFFARRDDTMSYYLYREDVKNA